MFQKHKAFCSAYEPQRRNSTICPPRAAQSAIPPLSTGRAATPFEARIEAAMPARAPLSQIVTTGRSVGTSAPQIGKEAVRDVAAAGDVAVVALVALADVDQLDAVLEQPAELVEVDGLDAFRAAAEHVSLELEEADGVQAADRAAASSAVAACTTIRSSRSSTKPAFVANELPETGTLRAPRRWPAPYEGASRTSRTTASSGGAASSPTSLGAPTNGPRLRSTSRLMFGGFGAEVEASATKSSSSVDLERSIEAALEADRGGRLGAHALAAERARDVAGEDLDAVRKLEQPAQRVKEPFRALLRGHREVWTRGVADEERVAGQHEPGLVGTRAVDDGEARVLGPVPGCVDGAQDDLAELQLDTVVEGVVWILGLCRAVDRHRDPVLEREPAVAGQMVGVRVRLDHPHDLHISPGGRLQHLFDRIRRIDDRSDACILVADQIRRTAQVVVQKLLEQHER